MLLWILYVMKDNYFDARMLPSKGILIRLKCYLISIDKMGPVQLLFSELRRR